MRIIAVSIAIRMQSQLSASSSTAYTVAAAGLSDTVESTQRTNATGVATLTGVNFMRITWSAVGGASLYYIFRRTAGTNPSTLGFIGSTSALTFDDTGLPVLAYTRTQQPMAFIQRWASYNRQRIRQRILAGLIA